VKNSDLVGSIESLNALAALKLPVRTSFTVALNLKAIRDHIGVLDEERKKVADKHTLKDADGKPLPVYKLDDAGKEVLKDGKPEILEGRIRIDNIQSFNDDMEALLSVDVSDVVNIKQVKLADLEGSIEPQHLAAVLWMINAE
jgi:predicted house-cleaning noncanonical NTP pyrophosphatase (MazG superfamily)